jgi:DNA-binding NarL/FixJ family response regulator
MTSAERPIRVLLVDDHKTMLWGLGRLIGSEGVAMEVVGTASDCASALALTAALAPDVVVLDLDLNGACSLEILPQLVAAPGTRVLVLSGTRDRELLDQAVLQGAHGVVGKDAAPDILLKAVHKVHQGELWLEHGMLGRLLDQIRHPSQQPPLTTADPLGSLTAKERKICELLAAGSAVNKSLAKQLFISDHTLRNHLTTIYQKLGVSNRLDLYMFVTRHGIGQR